MGKQWSKCVKGNGILLKDKKDKRRRDRKEIHTERNKKKKVDTKS